MDKIKGRVVILEYMNTCIMHQLMSTIENSKFSPRFTVNVVV